MPYVPHLEAAIHELGQSERKGRVHNDRIVAYHQATTLAASDDETPWCSSFVCWCLEVSGLRSTQSAAARSFLSWGQEVALAEALRGDIVVLSRNKPWQGHVGFFWGHGPDGKIQVLGGNQDGRVSVQDYDSDRLLSVRRAWGEQ